MEINTWSPFVKLDYLNIKKPDPYYQSRKEKVLSLGLNYRPSFTTEFKVQYTHKNIAGIKNKSMSAAQMAIGF